MWQNNNILVLNINLSDQFEHQFEENVLDRSENYLNFLAIKDYNVKRYFIQWDDI